MLKSTIVTSRKAAFDEKANSDRVPKALSLRETVLRYLTPLRDRKRRAFDAVTQLYKANRTTFQVLCDNQPKMTTYRSLLTVGSIASPVLGWWGSSQLVEKLTSGGSLESAAFGAVALGTSVAFTGFNPVAQSCIKRMSDSCTFNHVLDRFTRKLTGFTTEDLSDQELSEQVKRGRERVIWRMIAMASDQMRLVQTAGMFVVTGATVAYHAPELLPLLLCSGIPSIYSELRHAVKHTELETELSTKWAGLWSDLASLMQMLPLAQLQMFGAAEWFGTRFRVNLGDSCNKEIALESNGALKRILCSLLNGIGIAASIAMLFFKAREHEISAGEFVLLSGAATGLAGCLGEMASIIGMQLSHSVTINEFSDYLKHKASKEVSMRCLTHDGEESLTALCAHASELTDVHLEFIKLWHQYKNTEDGKFAIRNFSAKILRRKIVAIIGPNGAGKSTVMSTLLRQFKATHGSIQINGKDISAMSMKEFAREVVMLPQKMQHYNLTVRELLNLGRQGNPLSDDALWVELKRFKVDGVVRKWKNGLGTVLGSERREGVEPSGGELQRLLLAAVAITERGLVVLDEPVSAVDTTAAKEFWDVLFTERKDRTVLFSTHQLGAVKRADWILFVADGGLKDQGTHDELMERCEEYREMYDAQALEYR